MKCNKMMEILEGCSFISHNMKQSMFRFQTLRDCVERMNVEDVAARQRQEVEGECCICMNDFGRSIDIVTTKCGHQFHPLCLTDALVSSASHCCPLCRTAMNDVVPASLDGDLIRFIAKVRININAMQRYYDEMFLPIQQEFSVLEKKGKAMCLSRFTFGKWGRSGSCKAMDGLKDRLDKLLIFVCINCEAVRKIMRKLDKRVGTSISEEFLRIHLLDHEFAKSCLLDDGKAVLLAHRIQESKASSSQPRGKMPWSSSPDLPFTDEDEYANIRSETKVAQIMKAERAGTRWAVSCSAPAVVMTFQTGHTMAT